MQVLTSEGVTSTDSIEELILSNVEPIVIDNATDYFDAGEKFLKAVDLISIQKESYSNFINRVIPHYLNRVYTNRNSYKNKSSQVAVEIEDWYLDSASVLSEEYCKKNKLSREVALYANIKIIIQKYVATKLAIHPHVRLQKVLITKFPVLSENGTLIMNGVEKVIVSHLEPTPKIRLEVILQKKKAGNKELKFTTATRVNTKSGTVLSNTVIVKQDNKSSNYVIGIGNRTYKIVPLLRELMKSAVSPSVIRDILGISQQLLNEINVENTQSGFEKFAPEVLNDFDIRYVERNSLNERLSYASRAVGRKLASSLVHGDRVLASVGDVVTREIADEAQFLGLDLFVFPKNSIQLPVKIVNNNFIDADILYKTMPELGIQPDFTKGTKINRIRFNEVVRESEETGVNLEYLLKYYYDDLFGTHLLPDDIVAIINLYGAFLSGDEEEDDIDSLSTKGIVNISELYEEYLSIRFRETELTSYIINNIEASFAAYVREMGSTKSQVAVDEYKQLEFQLDCKDNQTVTSLLAVCSLLDQADTTGPLAQVNHRRKVSLKQVENRGGTPSTSSDVKPRSVNPSYIGRLDCVESPEGENIGLVRYLTTFARININGLIEAPFFRVNKQTMEIDYKHVYYLDYSKESKLVRAIGAKICRQDEVLIKLYKGNGNDKYLFDTITYPVEYKRYPVTAKKSTRGERYKDFITYDDKIDKILEQENNTSYIGSYDIEGDIDFDSLAKSMMKKSNADSYELVYHKKNWFEDPTSISCSVGHGKLELLDYSKVDVVSIRGEHILSPVNSTVPFSQNNDAVRLLMSSAQNKQAVCVGGAMKPSVTTKITDKIASTAVGVVTASDDGIVKSVDASKIVLETFDGRLVEIPLVTNFKSVENTLLYSRPTVRAGDVVMKNDLIADSNMSQDGTTAHGTELTVVYMPLYGSNFEDSIVISDKLVKDSTLTSLHNIVMNKELSCDKPPFTDQLSKEVLQKYHETKTSDSDPFKTITVDNFTKDWLIKPGTVVEPNDILAFYVKYDKDPKDGGIPEIKRFVYPEQEVCYVLDSRIAEIDKVKQISITLAHEENIRPGDKMSGRHGNKGVISRVLPACDMPYAEDGRIADIVLTPLGVPSRMNIGQLYEAEIIPILKLYGLSIGVDSISSFNVKAFKELVSKARQPEKGDISIREEYSGKLLDKREIVPDKAVPLKFDLTKGTYNLYPYNVETEVYSINVISKANPDNRFTVTFEGFDNGYIMNETEITRNELVNINVIARAGYPVKIKSITDKIVRSGDTLSKVEEVNYNNDEVSELSKVFLFPSGCDDLTRYIQFELHDDCIVEVVAMVAEVDDKVQLYDGMTGDKFEKKSVMGTMYALKLKHQATHKIHARQTGQYNISQQPPQGKDKNGGQKIGPMEMWALAEHRVPAVLEELFTFKTDDTAGRKRFEDYKKKKILGTSAGASESKFSLGTAVTNSPYAFKRIDATFKSAFIGTKYFNVDGEEISPLEDISQQNNKLGIRSIAELVKREREAVHSRYQSLKNSDRSLVYSSMNDTVKSSADVLTLQNSYGVDGSKLAPVEGYSEEYKLCGSYNLSFLDRFKKSLGGIDAINTTASLLEDNLGGAVDDLGFDMEDMYMADVDSDELFDVPQEDLGQSVFNIADDTSISPTTADLSIPNFNIDEDEYLAEVVNLDNYDIQSDDEPDGVKDDDSGDAIIEEDGYTDE